MFMTKEEAANCKEAAMPVESEAEYLVWSKVTRFFQNGIFEPVHEISFGQKHSVGAL